MKVGFIGLGRMGAAMAGRILADGHDIVVYNRTAAKAADLVARGAKQAQSVAEAARHGDVVITMLENDTALNAVAYGEGGLLRAMPKGAIHLVMGTHGLEIIRQLDQAHAEKSQVLLCAPVLGRPPVAAAGQLGIIVGGPAGAAQTCQPLFAVIGRRTFEAGHAPEQAAAAKLANNFLIACAIESMGEAFTLVEKSGVAREVLYDVLTDGLFAAPVYKVYGRIIADKAFFDPAQFAATTGLKDLNLVLAAGNDLAVPLPIAGICRDHLLGAIAHGHGDLDWTVMALEQARASGIDQAPETGGAAGRSVVR
jgi:3-hydroxyisobutyrate dehydrogenase-like beta-hydroxyacid dehydrogenase